ncbi:hypothetical protein AVEN_219215-1 [Araneus ventricosus]|uniref:Uncharacterized protein n=1 Tax=Araneus ventricosus TaxID=182803 RepID=A0A4Y2WN00_ARAVE|nr:hypothetical protein AVEN_219215-1 [Araneus ventricosus]
MLLLTGKFYVMCDDAALTGKSYVQVIRRHFNRKPYTEMDSTPLSTECPCRGLTSVFNRMSKWRRGNRRRFQPECLYVEV